MTDTRRTAMTLAAAAGSGGAFALAFEPYGLWPLAGIALVPVLLATTRASLVLTFAAGLLFGLVQAALSMPWMFHLFGSLALLLFVQYACYFAATFTLVRTATKSWGDGALLWAAPLAWVSVEWVRSEVSWPKFSWFQAGSALHADLPLLQTASWWGAYGLSAIVVALNAALAVSLLKQDWRPAVIGLAVVAGLHGVGVTMMGREEGRLAVACVEGEQVGIHSFTTRIDEAMRRAPGTRLVVLPEYTTFHLESDTTPAFQALSEAARRHKVTLAFGAKETASVGDFYNMLFVFGPDGRLVHRQAKPVPVPLMGDGRPAEVRRPAETELGQLGFATCYDMDFSFVSRDLVAKGAELLVFPTMDEQSWGTVQRRQHAALAALRAVEHRRWLVRCASSGISLTADPWGRVIPGEEILLATVGVRNETTFYTRWGYWLPHACALGTIMLLLCYPGYQTLRGSSGERR